MKHRNKEIMAVMVLLITAVLTYHQLQDMANLKSRYHAVSVRINKTGVTEQAINRALKEEGSRGGADLPAVTAWTRAEEVLIEDPVLGHSVRITPVIVFGDMKLVSPITIINGNLAYKDDENGCVLDTDTAYELYGTKDAAGNTLRYQNKIYYVRGVVRSKYPLLMVQGSDSKLEYNNLELLYHNKERGEEFAGQFMYQNSLGSDFTVIDGYFYARMIGAILCIPIWLFYLVAVLVITHTAIRCRRAFKLSEQLILGVVCSLLIIGFGSLLIRYAGMPFYLPEKLIPTKWSDFDYWSNQYQLIMEQLMQMRLLSPNPKDILLEGELISLPYRFLTDMILYALCLYILISNFMTYTPERLQGAKAL